MFFESFALNATVALGLIIALTFDYITKFFTYWYVRHVSYKTPVPFFGSDYHRVLGLTSNTAEVNNLYFSHLKEDLFGRIKSRIPDLIVIAPDLIEKVLSTAFENFQSRGIDLNKSQDVCLRDNLFYADGEKWTLLREGFESLLHDMTCVDDRLSDCLSGTNGDTNVKKVLSEVLDAVFKDLLLDDVDGSVVTELRENLQKITLLDKVKSYLKNIFPSIYTTFQLKTLSFEPSKESLKLIRESKFRTKVEKMLEVKEKKKSLLSKPDDFVVGVLITFITEGYIPCLHILTSLFFELSKDLEVQKKARNSDYYLEAAIKETMRLYPTHSIITRKCVKTYKFPEINDNKVLIDRGVTVNVPVEALHRDNNYYVEANSFKPERFLTDFLLSEYVYLPFGAGPRKCVGEKLAQQIIRTVAKVILRRYTIEPTEKTPAHLPVVDHNFGRVISTDIWLNFKPIEI